MQLTLKQKFFSLKEHFFITDETGQEQYEVIGALLSLGHRLTIQDMEGSQVGQVRQKLLSLTAKYFLQMGDQEEVELKRHVTLFKDHYTLSLPQGNWEIRGDFINHEYSMTQGERTVASVTRKLFSWGDTYLLDIPDPKDAMLALGVMLAIDCVLADAKNAQNSVHASHSS